MASKLTYQILDKDYDLSKSYGYSKDGEKVPFDIEAVILIVKEGYVISFDDLDIALEYISRNKPEYVSLNKEKLH